ncbi:hypothetical protein [Methanolobus sp. ZRKC5]|uniref:hypothetical protein n=1 Tax=unclassified Methanolobus TaxID=2629569 RepID=UPI00313D6B11
MAATSLKDGKKWFLVAAINVFSASWAYTFFLNPYPSKGKNSMNMGERGSLLEKRVPAPEQHERKIFRYILDGSALCTA